MQLIKAMRHTYYFTNKHSQNHSYLNSNQVALIDPLKLQLLIAIRIQYVWWKRTLHFFYWAYWVTIDRCFADEMQTLSFSYAQAQDYPVDLYYLMDLSRSMKNDKDKLSTLGGLLSSTMRNITSKFRIGFGSFVDKLVMPYVSTVPKK